MFCTSPTALLDVISVCFIVFPEFEWSLLGNTCAWMLQSVAINVATGFHFRCRYSFLAPCNWFYLRDLYE